MQSIRWDNFSRVYLSQKQTYNKRFVNLLDIVSLQKLTVWHTIWIYNTYIDEQRKARKMQYMAIFWDSFFENEASVNVSVDELTDFIDDVNEKLKDGENVVDDVYEFIDEMFTERFGVALLNDDTFALWTMEDVIEFAMAMPKFSLWKIKPTRPTWIKTCQIAGLCF